MSKPRKSGAQPVAHLALPEFSNYEEHKRAIDWSIAVGAQHDIRWDQLVPPLPLRPEELVALADSTSALGYGNTGRWGEITYKRIDGRAPWRNVPTGYFQRVNGVGIIVIRWREQTCGGCEVHMLCKSSTASVTQHSLVSARSHKQVAFDSLDQAANEMQATANARGNCPSTWDWLPPLPRTEEMHPWIAQRYVKDANYSVNSGPPFARITRRGFGSCRWVIEERPNMIRVLRNNRYARDGSGNMATFPSVDVAKEFCAREDEMSYNH
jgi:hypothetical protein